MELHYHNSVFTYFITVDYSDDAFLDGNLFEIVFYFRNMNNCERRECKISPNVFHLFLD